jgi:hypothetical protein
MAMVLPRIRFNPTVLRQHEVDSLSLRSYRHPGHLGEHVREQGWMLLLTTKIQAAPSIVKRATVNDVATLGYGE